MYRAAQSRDLLPAVHRWSSVSRRAAGRQLPLPRFHRHVWEPNPRRRCAILQSCAGTKHTHTHTLVTWEILSVKPAESSCCVSRVRKALPRTVTDGIHQSPVSTLPSLCASSPSSPTTTLWETAYRGKWATVRVPHHCSLMHRIKLFSLFPHPLPQSPGPAASCKTCRLWGNDQRVFCQTVSGSSASSWSAARGQETFTFSEFFSCSV